MVENPSVVAESILSLTARDIGALRGLGATPSGFLVSSRKRTEIGRLIRDTSSAACKQRL